MHDSVLRIFEKSLGLSHHPLIKLIALVQEWMLAAKDNHVPGSCLHQRNMSGLNVRCTEYREIPEWGEALPRDIGLSCLLKCVVWISFCPAVSFSRSKRYRCTEISADIDADRPGTNSLYEGTHINTCHGCQLSWTIYMMWRSSSGKCVVNTMIKKKSKGESSLSRGCTKCVTTT